MASYFLSLAVAETVHWRPQVAAFNTQPLALSCGACYPLQAKALFPPSWNRQVWLLRGVLKVGVWSLRPQGKEGAQQSPGTADPRTSPSILSRAWRRWGEGEQGPPIHTAPSVPATQCTSGQRGRQPGPTHASTIWEPLPGLGGPAEEAGFCPGAQSGSILISRGTA